ncbi:hypothetical protein Enr13x_65800 [Stieleria neptunia]|uniref:Uncharacterized protein n=1 Tax=Stieleria neptunia TaxID=2527979 RepID=A0A518I0N7_9BACT|nr:hypothetical protein [Stieleria neptunia]QDV46671.1 hypothetical protein Enr13x_65800 [Stieleria neptunia]
MFKYVCLGTLLCALTFGVASSIGQTPQETKPSGDDRIVALEKELSALTERMKELERAAGPQDKQKSFAYFFTNHDVIAIQPKLERLLTRSVNLGLSIGVDARSNRIVATGTEIQLSQLTLLVTLIDEGMIQP